MGACQHHLLLSIGWIFQVEALQGCRWCIWIHIWCFLIYNLAGFPLCCHCTDCICHLSSTWLVTVFYFVGQQFVCLYLLDTSFVLSLVERNAISLIIRENKLYFTLIYIIKNKYKCIWIWIYMLPWYLYKVSAARADIAVNGYVLWL